MKPHVTDIAPAKRARQKRTGATAVMYGGSYCAQPGCQVPSVGVLAVNRVDSTIQASTDRAFCDEHLRQQLVKLSTSKSVQERFDMDTWVIQYRKGVNP